MLLPLLLQVLATLLPVGSQLINGQFFIQGLAIINSPQPQSTVHAGSNMNIAIDLSGNGKLDQSAFLSSSGASTRYQLLELYIVGGGSNVTVSQGTGLLSQQSGSTVKHLNFDLPSCLTSGSYHLNVHESSFINSQFFYSITSIPLNVENSNSKGKKRYSSNKIRRDNGNGRGGDGNDNNRNNGGGGNGNENKQERGGSDGSDNGRNKGNKVDSTGGSNKCNQNSVQSSPQAQNPRSKCPWTDNDFNAQTGASSSSKESTSTATSTSLNTPEVTAVSTTFKQLAAGGATSTTSAADVSVIISSSVTTPSSATSFVALSQTSSSATSTTSTATSSSPATPPSVPIIMTTQTLFGPVPSTISIATDSTLTLLLIQPTATITTPLSAPSQSVIPLFQVLTHISGTIRHITEVGYLVSICCWSTVLLGLW